MYNTRPIGILLWILTIYGDVHQISLAIAGLLPLPGLKYVCNVLMWDPKSKKRYKINYNLNFSWTKSTWLLCFDIFGGNMLYLLLNFVNILPKRQTKVTHNGRMCQSSKKVLKCAWLTTKPTANRAADACQGAGWHVPANILAADEELKWHMHTQTWMPASKNASAWSGGRARTHARHTPTHGG